MTTQPAAPGRRRTSDVISAEVRAWAARLGLKQSDLARVLRISQGQISARLNGHIAWNADEVDLLAEALGVEPTELMTPPRGMTLGARELSASPTVTAGQGNPDHAARFRCALPLAQRIRPAVRRSPRRTTPPTRRERREPMHMQQQTRLHVA